MNIYEISIWHHEPIKTICTKERNSLIYSYRRIELINHIYASYHSINNAITDIIRSHFEFSLNQHSDYSIKDEALFINESNILLGNFLTAFRLFLDSTERILLEVSPKKAYRKLKETKNEFFDSSELYPFCYRLRNYVQHYGYAVESATNETSQAQTGIAISTMTAIIRKSSLLKKRSFWNSRSLAALDNMPKEIDIKLIIGEVTLAAQTFLGAIAKDLFEIRRKHYTVINELIAYDKRTSILVFNLKKKDSNRYDRFSIEVIERLEGKPSEPRLQKLDNFCFSMIPYSKLRDLGYPYGLRSVPAKNSIKFNNS